MNAFLNILDSGNLLKNSCLKRAGLTILQVNAGNLCSQKCRHCHFDASPQGNNMRKNEEVFNRQEKFDNFAA